MPNEKHRHTMCGLSSACDFPVLNWFRRFLSPADHGAVSQPHNFFFIRIELL